MPGAHKSFHFIFGQEEKIERDGVGIHKERITRETNSPSILYQKNIGPRYRRTGASPRSILFFLPFYISILTNGGRRGEMGQRCVSVCGFCMCSVNVHTYGEVVNGLANCTAEGGGGKQGKRISTSDYG